MSQPIINRPDLQSFRQKYGQSLITVLFWVLFFFFMRPLVGILGWVFGYELFTDVMVVKGGYHSLLELLGWYFGIILLMGVILKGWALYNLFRYGRHEKRHRQPNPVTVQELAQHFRLASVHLHSWQTARRVVLEHDDDGLLINPPEGGGYAAPAVNAKGKLRGPSASFPHGSHLSHPGAT